MNNSNTVLILAISIISAALIGAFVAIALLYPGDKGVVLAALALLTGAIFTQLANFKVSTDAKTAAVASIEVSRENAHSIAVVSEQTNHGLEGVNHKVDGHMTEMRKELATSHALNAELIKKNASLEQDKAVKQERAEQAETSESKILTAIAALPSAPAAEIVPPPDGSVNRPGEHL